MDEVTDTEDEGCPVEEMAVEKVDDGARLVAAWAEAAPIADRTATEENERILYYE